MLTVKAAAQRAGVSISLIYALLRLKRIPAYRVGARGRGKWLIDEADLDGFLANCKAEQLKEAKEEEYKYLK